MNIKNQLGLVIFVVFLLFAIFGGSIYIGLQNYQQALHKADIVNTISTAVFERRILADEYIANKGERAKLQWFSKQQSIKDTIDLNKNEFVDLSEKELIDNIKKSLDGSETIFNQYVDFDLKYPESTGSSRLENNNRLSSQLSVNAQETVAAASTLADINLKIEKDSFNQILTLFLVALVIFFLLLTMAFSLIWKSANKLDFSNERFDFVSRATKDAIYDWNIITNNLWFNDGFLKLFEYKKEDVDLTFNWWLEQIHPDDKVRVNQQRNQILESSSDIIELQYRFKKGSGQYAQVLDQAYLVRNSSGKAERFIGVMQDVTISTQYESELKKRTDEAERLNKITVDRELKMIELKQELAKLKGNLPEDKQ